MKAWLPPSPKRSLPAARAATWAAQERKPQSNFRDAFSGKLFNHRWGLTPPKKEQGK
jgi:hypothetical protein